MLFKWLREHGFVGARAFVLRYEVALWEIMVEVDYMRPEARAEIRSMGAFVRHLVREACGE